MKTMAKASFSASVEDTQGLWTLSLTMTVDEWSSLMGKIDLKTIDWDFGKSLKTLIEVMLPTTAPAKHDAQPAETGAPPWFVPLPGVTPQQSGGLGSWQYKNGDHFATMPIFAYNDVNFCLVTEWGNGSCEWRVELRMKGIEYRLKVERGYKTLAAAARDAQEWWVEHRHEFIKDAWANEHRYK